MFTTTGRLKVNVVHVAVIRRFVASPTSPVLSAGKEKMRR